MTYLVLVSFVAPTKGPEILHVCMAQENFPAFQAPPHLFILINILLLNWTSIFEWKFLCVFQFALQALLRLWTGKSKDCGHRTVGKAGTRSRSQSWCCESSKRCSASSEDVAVDTWSPPCQKPLHRGHMAWLLGAAASFILIHSCKTWGGEKKASYQLARFFVFFPAVPDTIKWLNRHICASS